MKAATHTTSPTRFDATQAAAAARIAGAIDTPDPAVLIRLRRASKPTKNPVSLAQATAIVDGVVAGQSRDDICRQTGLDADEVLDVVASFGTRMRHRRPGPTFTLVKAAELAPGVTPGPCADGSVVVVIPAGFERAGSGRRRDVTQALGSLVASQPTPEEIGDWVARQRPAAASVLEFTVVTMVHTFARFGRLEQIDEVNGDSPELAGTLVSALELLLGGLRKGLAGMLAVVNGATGDELARALDAARPLAEARLSRLVQVGGDLDAVERARRAFGAAIAGGVLEIPAAVGDLDAGQVLRLAQAAGLGQVETNRTDETAIRSRLADLGLAQAADQLVPAGARAVRAGLEEAFWEAMELRAAGEEEWDEPLRRAAAHQAESLPA